MFTPWCRFRLFRLKSPVGLRTSRNSSISGWCTSRYAAAEPRRHVATDLDRAEPSIELAVSYNLKEKDLTRVRKLIEEHEDEIRTAWHSHFNR